MNMLNKQLAMGVTLALASSAALAGDYYVTAQLGASLQAADSEPYGNNIAADADFPSAFENDNGAVGSIGAGYQVSDQLRVEGRIGYRSSDFNETRYGTGARNGAEYRLNGDIESTTFTVEGFYDFATGTAFKPYVKAGVGVSNNKYAARLGGAGVAAFDAFDGTADGYYDNYADGDSTEFSWNLGVGASYVLTNNIAVYGEYQYVSFGDVATGQDSFTDGFKIDDASAHEFMTGIRFTF